MRLPHRAIPVVAAVAAVLAVVSVLPLSASPRRAASIDLAHDEADLVQTVKAPLLALWGAHGRIAPAFDVLATWRERAADVRGTSLPCGHFLAEEAPDETYQALESFFRS